MSLLLCVHPDMAECSVDCQVTIRPNTEEGTLIELGRHQMNKMPIGQTPPLLNTMLAVVDCIPRKGHVQAPNPGMPACVETNIDQGHTIVSMKKTHTHIDTYKHTHSYI